MTELAPFREGPKFLLCPRCGEILESAFEGVVMCLRCEGVWLTPATLVAAFGDPRWPSRVHTMWWRDELECPECRTAGTRTVMTALNADGTQIDRCPAHGLWLDRGELGRLMGATTDELTALRQLISGAEGDDTLTERRATWRQEAATRRQAADEYRRWLEAENRRRTDAEAEIEREARAARERRVTERREAEQRAERDPQVAPVRPTPTPAAAARIAADAADRTRAAEQVQRQRDRERLDEAQAAALAEVARTEAHLVGLRTQLRRCEADLDGARARLRVINEQLRRL